MMTLSHCFTNLAPGEDTSTKKICDSENMNRTQQKGAASPTVATHFNTVDAHGVRLIRRRPLLICERVR